MCSTQGPSFVSKMKFLPELKERVEQLVHRIRPASHSETRRQHIVDYMSSIVTSVFPQATAMPFGSVPLRTYLPDGDIDLSIFCPDPSIKDNWAPRLHGKLEEIQRSPHAPFQIGDAQVINAEVKLVKCLVDNIVVDISLNQYGGLCALAFLEQIDNTIVANHVFKKSIILVKAWCYYESRVLGAHHGLLSTYGLETLVLYIFNLYHRHTTNPLEVLYLFLSEFSTFDWDHYCLSLHGPVPLSSFPDFKVETPPHLASDPLMTEQVMARLSRFSPANHLPPAAPPPARPHPNDPSAPAGKLHVGTPGAHGVHGSHQGKVFTIKSLNIMDPLLPTNNLGRSVSKANFLRIRRAFAHGARTLEAIMEKDPEEGISALDNFFRSAWNAQRPHRYHRQEAQALALQAQGAVPGPRDPREAAAALQQQQQQTIFTGGLPGVAAAAAKAAALVFQHVNSGGRQGRHGVQEGPGMFARTSSPDLHAFFGHAGHGGHGYAHPHFAHSHSMPSTPTYGSWTDRSHMGGALSRSQGTESEHLLSQVDMLAHAAAMQAVQHHPGSQHGLAHQPFPGIDQLMMSLGHRLKPHPSHAPHLPGAPQQGGRSESGGAGLSEAQGTEGRRQGGAPTQEERGPLSQEDAASLDTGAVPAGEQPSPHGAPITPCDSTGGADVQAAAAADGQAQTGGTSRAGADSASASVQKGAPPPSDLPFSVPSIATQPGALKPAGHTTAQLPAPAQAAGGHHSAAAAQPVPLTPVGAETSPRSPARAATASSTVSPAKAQGADPAPGGPRYSRASVGDSTQPGDDATDAGAVPGSTAQEEQEGGAQAAASRPAPHQQSQRPRSQVPHISQPVIMALQAALAAQQHSDSQQQQASRACHLAAQAQLAQQQQQHYSAAALLAGMLSKRSSQTQAPLPPHPPAPEPAPAPPTAAHTTTPQPAADPEADSLPVAAAAHLPPPAPAPPTAVSSTQAGDDVGAEASGHTATQPTQPQQPPPPVPNLDQAMMELLRLRGEMHGTSVPAAVPGAGSMPHPPPQRPRPPTPMPPACLDASQLHVMSQLVASGVQPLTAMQAALATAAASNGVPHPAAGQDANAQLQLWAGLMVQLLQSQQQQQQQHGGERAGAPPEGSPGNTSSGDAAEVSQEGAAQGTNAPANTPSTTPSSSLSHGVPDAGRSSHAHPPSMHPAAAIQYYRNTPPMMGQYGGGSYEGALIGLSPPSPHLPHLPPPPPPAFAHNIQHSPPSWAYTGPPGGWGPGMVPRGPPTRPMYGAPDASRPGGGGRWSGVGDEGCVGEGQGWRDRHGLGVGSRRLDPESLAGDLETLDRSLHIAKMCVLSSLGVRTGGEAQGRPSPASAPTTPSAPTPFVHMQPPPPPPPPPPRPPSKSATGTPTMGTSPPGAAAATTAAAAPRGDAGADSMGRPLARPDAPLQRSQVQNPPLPLPLEVVLPHAMAAAGAAPAHPPAAQNEELMVREAEGADAGSIPGLPTQSALLQQQLQGQGSVEEIGSFTLSELESVLSEEGGRTNNTRGPGGGRLTPAMSDAGEQLGIGPLSDLWSDDGCSTVAADARSTADVPFPAPPPTRPHASSSLPSPLLLVPAPPPPPPPPPPTTTTGVAPHAQDRVLSQSPVQARRSVPSHSAPPAALVPPIIHAPPPPPPTLPTAAPGVQPGPSTKPAVPIPPSHVPTVHVQTTPLPSQPPYGVPHPPPVAHALPSLPPARPPGPPQGATPHQQAQGQPHKPGSVPLGKPVGVGAPPGGMQPGPMGLHGILLPGMTLSNAYMLPATMMVPMGPVDPSAMRGQGPGGGQGYFLGPPPGGLPFPGGRDGSGMPILAMPMPFQGGHMMGHTLIPHMGAFPVSHGGAGMGALLASMQQQQQGQQQQGQQGSGSMHGASVGPGAARRSVGSCSSIRDDGKGGMPEDGVVSSSAHGERRASLGSHTGYMGDMGGAMGGVPHVVGARGMGGKGGMGSGIPTGAAIPNAANAGVHGAQPNATSTLHSITANQAAAAAAAVLAAASATWEREPANKAAAVAAAAPAQQPFALHHPQPPQPQHPDGRGAEAWAASVPFTVPAPPTATHSEVAPPPPIALPPMMLATPHSGPPFTLTHTQANPLAAHMALPTPQPPAPAPPQHTLPHALPDLQSAPHIAPPHPTRPDQGPCRQQQQQAAPRHSNAWGDGEPAPTPPQPLQPAPPPPPPSHRKSSTQGPSQPAGHTPAAPPQQAAAATGGQQVPTADVREAAPHPNSAPPQPQDWAQAGGMQQGSLGAPREGGTGGTGTGRARSRQAASPARGTSGSGSAPAAPSSSPAPPPAPSGGLEGVSRAGQDQVAVVAAAAATRAVAAARYLPPHHPERERMEKLAAEKAAVDGEVMTSPYRSRGPSEGARTTAAGAGGQPAGAGGQQGWDGAAAGPPTSTPTRTLPSKSTAAAASPLRDKTLADILMKNLMHQQQPQPQPQPTPLAPTDSTAGAATAERGAERPLPPRPGSGPGHKGGQGGGPVGEGGGARRSSGRQGSSGGGRGAGGGGEHSRTPEDGESGGSSASRQRPHTGGEGGEGGKGRAGSSGRGGHGSHPGSHQGGQRERRGAGGQAGYRASHEDASSVTSAPRSTAAPSTPSHRPHHSQGGRDGAARVGRDSWHGSGQQGGGGGAGGGSSGSRGHPGPSGGQGQGAGGERQGQERGGGGQGGRHGERRAQGPSQGFGPASEASDCPPQSQGRRHKSHAHPHSHSQKREEHGGGGGDVAKGKGGGKS